MPHHEHSEHPHTETIHVRVITTAGSFPAHGFESVNAETLISAVLAEAVAKLHIADTGGWVATVDGNEVVTTQSFASAQLQGHVKIDFGAREGGGG